MGGARLVTRCAVIISKAHALVYGEDPESGGFSSLRLGDPAPDQARMVAPVRFEQSLELQVSFIFGGTSLVGFQVGFQKLQ